MAELAGSIVGLISADHSRLSQGWSTWKSSENDYTISASNTGAFALDAARNSLTQDARQPGLSFTAFGQETVYKNFRTWLLGQPWSDQDKIVDKLREDVLSDRLPGDCATLSVVPSDTVPTPRLLKAIPLLQGHVAPSAPRVVNIRGANDSIIPFLSSSHGVVDHKRSRSDSILANATFNGRREAMRTRDETFFRLTGTRNSDAERW